MATLQELQRAMVAAHKAGDSDSARKLAAVIRREESARSSDPMMNEYYALDGDPRQVQEAIPQQQGPGFIDNVVGAADATKTFVTGMTSGAAGHIGGTIEGMIREAVAGEFGTYAAADRIAELAMKRAGQLTLEPKTEVGQNIVEGVGEMLEPLAAIPPIAQTQALAAAANRVPTNAIARQGAQQARVAATPVIEGAMAKAAPAVQSIKDGVAPAMKKMGEMIRPAPKPEADKSVGAAQVPMPVIRQEAVDSLPVKFDPLTQGQQTRDPDIQRFEHEIAKTPQGAKVRERFDNHNAQMIMAMDAMVDMTGRTTTTLRGVGEAVDDVLQARSKKDTDKIRTLYKEAEKRGELEAPVELNSVSDWLNNNRASRVEDGLMTKIQRKLDALEVSDGDFAEGSLKLKPMTLNQAEDLRSFINGETNSADRREVRVATIMKGLIDASTENVVVSGAAPTSAKTIGEVSSIVSKYKNNPNAARNEWGDTLDNICREPGNCSMVADTIINDLKSGGIDANMVVAQGAKNQTWLKNAGVRAGSEDDAHTVIQVGDKIIDVTARQFEPDAPQIKIMDIDEFKSSWGSVEGLKDVNTSRSVDTSFYKRARAARRKYAQDYENSLVIKNLLGTKRGSDDRAIALEDVVNKVVLADSVSLDQMRHLRRTLQTKTGGKEGPGAQAWKEVQGATVEHLKNLMERNSSTNARGDTIVSIAALEKEIKRLDKSGKLDYILGSKGAEQIRTIKDVGKYITTTVPGAVNHSNTATVLAGLMDVAMSGVTGVPMPVASGVKFLKDKIKDKKLQARIKQTLGEE